MSKLIFRILLRYGLWNYVWYQILENYPYHSAPTGARNSSLGHPNMAAASHGKHIYKAISSLLHVSNGWYLQDLIILCVSLSGPQNLLCKRRNMAKRGGNISARDARISTPVPLLDARNLFQGCPKLLNDARISPTSTRIDAGISRKNTLVVVSFEHCVYPEIVNSVFGCHSKQLLNHAYVSVLISYKGMLIFQSGTIWQ